MWPLPQSRPSVLPFLTHRSYRMVMTLRFSVLIVTCVVVSCLLVPPAVAQLQSTGSPAQDPIGAEGTMLGHLPVASLASAVPPGATWREQQYHPNHAQGRANVVSLASLVVGSSLTASANPFDGSSWTPRYVTGTCLSALGIVVGPSLGLWCTGHNRVAWQSLAVRAGGMGALGIGIWRLVRTDDAADVTPGDIIAAPFRFVMYALPGLLITSAGISWAFRATPNRWCEGTPQAQATLQPQVDETGQGLALRVTW